MKILFLSFSNNNKNKQTKPYLLILFFFWQTQIAFFHLSQIWPSSSPRLWPKSSDCPPLWIIIVPPCLSQCRSQYDILNHVFSCQLLLKILSWILSFSWYKIRVFLVYILCVCSLKLSLTCPSLRQQPSLILLQHHWLSDSSALSLLHQGIPTCFPCQQCSSPK